MAAARLAGADPATAPGRVYLLDHACFKPPEELRVIATELEEHGKHWPMYTEAARDFMWKVFVKSGISRESTFLPKAIHPKFSKEPSNDMATALVEAEMVMAGAMTDLFERTGLKPSDVDILVTCCSIFCPTPSLASMLVNHFKMRPDIQSYHLGGMGCGTGVVGVNLCKDLLKAHPNATLVFVPAEITTYCYYPGEDKNRMVANVIFRMGGAAVAMTNKPALKHRAKYELVAASRYHTGADDAAYGCMSWGPDADGVNGVFLGKGIVDAASKAIDGALRRVAPRVLTWTQYGQAAANLAQRKLLGRPVEPYTPNWTDCCTHFCLHAGGYAVLKGLQKGLKVPNNKMIPSFAGLREYGNTSCSSTWYSMAYIESCGGVRKGEQVLQLGVGGGMKAGVNVWRALRDVDAPHRVWTHLRGCPLTEADLPRSMDSGTITDPELARRAVETANAQWPGYAGTKPEGYTSTSAQQLRGERAVDLAQHHPEEEEEIEVA